MKIYFLLLIAFVFSCQSQPPSTDVVYNIEQTPVNSNIIQNQEQTKADEVISSTLLKCGGKYFNLLAVNANGRKNVTLAEGTTTIKTIDLPSGLEVNGFAFNWAKETKEGFEISIEYGSRYYYQKWFNFICKQGKYNLNEIKIDSFDKNNPETSWKKHRTVIKKVPLEEFVIADYIGY